MIKKYFQVDEDSQNQRRISIKWTWTILASLALFFTYMIFSIVLFVSVRKSLLTNEAENIRKVTEDVVEQLEYSYFPLNQESVEGQFSLDDLNISTEINMEEENIDIPVQNDIVIRVFNPAEGLVFSTFDEDFDFTAADSFQINEIEGLNNTAYSGVSPVYSMYNDNLIGYVQVINTLGSFYQIVEQIRNIIIIVGLVAIVFSALFGFLIARRFLKPIQKLTNKMDKIAKNPESAERIDAGRSNDELNDMADSFNKMIDRMQKNIDNQKRFVEDVSHELRTPVSVVEGHLNLLNRWGKDNPEVLDESIQDSLQEISRMDSLVQEMLDLSRAEQVDIHYQAQKTNLIEIVKLSHTNFKVVYPNFEINLDLNDHDEILVNMDRNHLEQIIVILLDNAIKYSTDQLEIDITVSIQKNNQVLISVQDYGEGMAEEDTQRIFDRFYRIDKARSRDRGGNGLGLPIAKQLAEGYQGDIWVKSKLGQGSIFYILLPILVEETNAPARKSK